MSQTTMTVFAAYEASASQASLGRLLEWLRFLKPENLAALKELLPALDDFMKATDIRGQVRAGLSIMTIIAGMTKSQTDDRIVEMLRSVATDELIDVLVGIIRGFLPADAKEYAAAAAGLSAARATAEAAGVPWQFLMQVALQLFDIISRFKK